MSDVSLRDMLTSAIRYWEVRRIGYNAVLALIVLGLFVLGLPQSRDQLTLNLAQGLFILAVLANVAYCTAYLVDIFAQLSGFRSTWLRFRWVLYVVGLVFGKRPVNPSRP